MRKDGLDAKNFFDPPNATKPKLDQKQFGGVVRGPVIKDKTFFLVNYDGTRKDKGFSSYFRVPNPNELAGHFSTTVIDPTTGQPYPVRLSKSGSSGGELTFDRFNESVTLTPPANAIDVSQLKTK